MANEQKPTKDTLRIMRVTDLPQARDQAMYQIQNGDQKPRVVTLEKRKRQIMDLLMQGPVYCASPVRISDVVHILKREVGLDVETRFYPGDKATGSGDYGVYFLKSQVRLLNSLGAAA